MAVYPKPHVRLSCEECGTPLPKEGSLTLCKVCAAAHELVLLGERIKAVRLQMRTTNATEQDPPADPTTPSGVRDNASLAEV